MSFKITGLDKLQKKLNDLQRKAEELHGEHEISFSELFNSSFMQRYTNFTSFEALIEASGFKVETPDDDWDKHIAKTTKFSNWQEMINAARSEWAKNQLRL